MLAVDLGTHGAKACASHGPHPSRELVCSPCCLNRAPFLTTSSGILVFCKLPRMLFGTRQKIKRIDKRIGGQVKDGQMKRETPGKE